MTKFFDHSYGLRSSRDTKDLYKAWAETYDAELGGERYAQPERAAEALKRLASSPDQSILDVGCGTGLSGLALTHAGYSTIDGCDYSTEMLDKAADLGVYRRLFEADLNQPLSSTSDATYDAVTAVGCFSFGHIDVAALRELVRILKPGGALVIAVNAPYHDTGVLPNELDALAEQGQLALEFSELGAHIPGRDVQGWIIGARVCETTQPAQQNPRQD